ncbi:hypothetical protein Emag_006281 [Eimeria magna]
MVHMLILYNVAVRVDCLNAINAAREEVDLPGFKKGETQGSKLPVDDPVTGDTPEEGRLAAIARSAPPENESEQVGRDDEQTKKKKFLEAVCKVILKARRLPLLLNCAGSMKEGTEESPQESELKGTYMYASQDSSDEICAAAVENWRGAVTNFPSVPPTYTAQELFYQKHENVSVVGLFNPKPNATVDCAIITCQREASKESEVEEAEEEEPGMNNHGRETGGRQELWDKIRGVENSATQPTVLAVLFAVSLLLLNSYSEAL